MAVNRIAQVSGNALAQPADHIKAPGRKQAKRHRDRKQLCKVGAQRHHLRALVGLHQTTIDECAQRQRERQRCGCRQHQEKQGQSYAQPVGPQERQQA
jgi:hypothetical protein